jgi:DnaK suppressor protein
VPTVNADPRADRRRVLQRALRRAAAEVAARKDQLDRAAEAAMTDGRDDEHDPDGSTPAFDHALAVGLVAQAERARADVEEALERLAAGDYGLCVACGQAIPDERLEAQPAAPTCVRCASRPRRLGGAASG